ncbi:MAG TPA: DJ-1/PfpI family protein [Candidatus Bathyarchaeia archaeon]|nr:DJ-1/PfpI family protein [Candidatus Bathyarchaeia archaeon]
MKEESKPVVLIVAFEGFQPQEYGTTKKVLEEGGYSVVTASTKKGAAVAKDGSTVPVDIPIKEVRAPAYDAIVFIGGPGTMPQLNNELSYTLIKSAVEHNKIVAAICIATRILAYAGVLTDKQATGWDGDNELAALYKDKQVKILREDVVVDGTIITATGPTAAQDFGKALVKALEENS